MSERDGRKYRTVHLSASVMGCDPTTCNESSHFYEEFVPAPPAPPSADPPFMVVMPEMVAENDAAITKLETALSRAEQELEKLREALTDIARIARKASVPKTTIAKRAEAALGEKGSESAPTS